MRKWRAPRIPQGQGAQERREYTGMLERVLEERYGSMAWIAAGTVVAHVATGGQYGFHRDELMALGDARHLSWGYVTYPPMTPLVARMALILFGTSLVEFRFFQQWRTCDDAAKTFHETLQPFRN
jgi:hypothetical protein